MIDCQINHIESDPFAATKLVHTGDAMHKRSKSGPLSTRIMGAALAAVLLLTSPIAPAWRHANEPEPDPDPDPAPEQASALWLRTNAAGLYGVTIADLAAALGQSSRTIGRSAQRGLLSLTNADQPVSWYFDSATDMILFAGETYDTFYTGENAYRFWKSSEMAQTMAVATGTPTGAAGSAAPFADTLIFEEEPDMFYSTGTVASEPDADYWFWDYLHGGFKDLIEVALDTPNPSSSGTAQLRVTLRGWTDLEAGDDHQVYAELNGVRVGPVVSFDGFEQAVLVADFDQSVLDSAGNNVLALRNIYVNGTHPGQWLDQIEIDYARRPAADNGALWMHDVAAGAQTVTGFAGGDIVVIESPGGAAKMRQDVRIENNAGDWSVTFEAASGADYLLAERSAMQAPALASDYTSDLQSSNNLADYLIIAPRDFKGTAEALAAYRSNRYGDVKIVWLEDIYDEFNAGREDPYAVTRFMDLVSQTWQAVPSVVTGIGKGSLDHKNRMGYADSFLPVIFTDTPWALAVSDDRLLGGNGDAPFAIGRLPITNDAEGMAYVDKLIAYESAIPGNERYHAVLVADDPDDGGSFYANSDLLSDRLLNTLGFDQVSKLYHLQDEVRASLTQSDTWETGYVSYDGHGSSTQVGDGSENFINAADAGLLQNVSYPIFTALTCAVGNFSQPGMRSLAGALVLNPAGGAIASMVPPGLSYDADAQILGNAFVDSFYGGNNTIGDAVAAAKLQSQGAINGFMQRMYTVIGEPAIYGR
jgi:hypothetical protein